MLGKGKPYFYENRQNRHKRAFKYHCDDADFGEPHIEDALVRLKVEGILPFTKPIPPIPLP